MLTKKSDGSQKWGFWLDAHHIKRHYLFDGVGLGKLVYTFSVVDQYACWISITDVTVCNDTNELFVRDNRELIDTVFGHYSPGNAEAIIDLNCQYLFSHPLRNLYRTRPPSKLF